MALKTLAIEHRRRSSDSAVTALHPGTVGTALWKPFSTPAPDDGLFTPDFATARLLEVIDGLTPEQSSGFFAWDGSAIPH